MKAINIQNLKFGWHAESYLLDIDQFSVDQGEQILLYGPSGCGKSSLLNLIAAVNRPSHGSIALLQTDVTQLSNTQADRFRAKHLGIIFQQFNLIPYLTVEDNIRLRCVLFGKIPQLNQRIERLLTSLQLTDQQYSLCSKLSLGQQQRVAIARALICEPEIIIADEPTSSLDPTNKELFMKLLQSEINQRGATLVMVSHDMDMHRYFSKTLRLTDINRAGVSQNVI
jgi:putative ABC transport system ATP-binding protein